MTFRLALIALLVALALPASAAGHATVTSTSPSQGAAVKKQPTQVVLRFSENVETQFGAVRVFDAQGKRVDQGSTSQPNGSSAAVKLKPGLPDGPYTATYNVVSADSHPVSGGFTFTVGRSGGQSAAAVGSLIDEGGTGAVTKTAFAVTKGVAYAATALLLGGALFLWLVWLPGLRQTAGAQPRWRRASEAAANRTRKIGVWAAVAGLLATAAGLAFQGASAAGTSFWSALDPTVIHDVLATSFGTAWAARLVAFLALVVVLALPPARARIPALRPASVGATGLALGRPPRPVVAVCALALVALAVTPALSGHANATDPRILMLGLDMAHVAAMSAWVGGVAFLVLVLPRATRLLETGERSQVLAVIVARFSTLAIVSVAALLASGVIQSWLHLHSFGELLSSGYGRAITIKSILVVVLIAAGAANRQRTLPRLRQAAAEGGSPGAAGVGLRRVIRGELALMAVAIGVTAVLVGYAPPATSASGPVSVNRDLGPARLEMTVAPARVGNNEIHLYLFDRKSGAQYDRPKEVSVSATLPDRRIGPLKLRTRKTGPGHYTVPAASLAPGGDWSLEVDALISEFDQYTTKVKVPIR